MLAVRDDTLYRAALASLALEFDVEPLRVRSADALREALEARHWDALVFEPGVAAAKEPGISDRARQFGERVPAFAVYSRIDEAHAEQLIRSGVRAVLGPTVAARLGSIVARELEEARSRRQRELRALVDSSPDPMLVVRDDGTIQHFNALAERLLGYRESEVLGQPIELLVPGRLRERHVALRESFAAAPQARPMGLGLELAARHKDSREIPIEISLGPVQLDGERLICCGLRDLRERRRAERLLRGILEGTAAQIGEAFLRALVKNLALALDVRCAFICELPRPGAELVRTLALWNGADYAPNFEYRMAGTPCEVAAGAGEVLVPAGAGARFPDAQNLLALQAECVFGLRLHSSSGAALGVLAIVDAKPLADEASARTVMRIFAARAGVELERLRGSTELAESEQRFRAMAELTSDYYWEQDENFRFTKRIGMLWEQRAGTVESVIGKTRWELPASNMSEADWGRHRADLVAQREFRDLEIERRLPSGESRWISTSGRPIFDAAGRFRGYRGVGRNITQRKRAELALREHERVRGALMRNLPGMVYRCANDPQWTLEFASEGCAELTGYAPGDFIGNRTLAYADLIHDEDRDQVWREVQEALAERQPFELQYRIRARDGTEKWVWERGAGVYAESGQLLALEGYITDVTSRVLGERASREGAERLRLFADNVPAMIAYSDAGYRFRYANRQFVDFYVGKLGSVEGRPMAEVLGAAAFASVRPGVERALSGEAVDYTAVRRRADGSLRHVDVSLVPHRGNAAQVLGVYTFIRDVTQSRQAESEAREAEQQFRLVADNVPAMIAYIGSDYRYRYANRSYIEFYGEGEAVKGKSAAEFLGAETWRAVSDSFGRAMAGETINYVRTHRRRSGRTRQVDVTLVPHLSEAGQALGIFVLALDVTSRRRSEEALRLRNRALESSVNAVMITASAAGGFEVAYVNPAFERMTGYAAAEAIGRSPRFLHGDDTDQPGLEALRSALREEREGSARIRNYRKDGTMFWLEVRIAPVRDEEGHVTHYVSAGSDVTDRVRYEQEIERHANYDTLTGLPNRNLLNDRLSQAIVKAERVKLPVAVLYLDLDHLKRINDSLGHVMGDSVIAAVGARLASVVRTGDTVARMGGDEFVIVLADLKREEDAAAVAAKILESVGAPLGIDGHEFVLSASVGVAIFPKDGADTATLLRNADAALYRMKEQGRDGYRFFATEMNERVVRFMTLEADMRRALDAKEFRLQYQPIVRLDSGEPVGAEALVRWHRADGSVTPPLDFIPVAEESGLIVPLGRWILESATRQAALWNKGRSKPLFVSINLSVRQFRDPKLLEAVRDALAASKIDPALVKLEITESAVMQDVAHAERSLRALKGLGVQLSVDDFGTGYSSLAYLKRFPIDTLKLDRSFVRDLPGDTDDLAISRAVIDLARGLDMHVVAEGVETRAQAEVLYANGCAFAQGYLFGRPEDPERLDFNAARGGRGTARRDH
ncbi:MAG: PAS domain S-box protein [Burkholderiales bacterium]